MDVDNDPVDQNLLLQFTCLGTTDRDDLVKQFRELIDRVNDSTASFYLEMNNWNLQNAICSFLDYSAPRTNLSMSLEETCLLESMPPNTAFVMRWTVRNDGTTAWPRDCTLRRIEGNHPCCSEIVPVDTVEPGRLTTVVVDLATPAVAGWYQSTWKMMSPSGVYFGDVLSLVFQVHVRLEETEEESLSEELAARMALIDNSECKVMEDESNRESTGVVPNPFSHSIEISRTDVSDIDQGDQNTS